MPFKLKKKNIPYKITAITQEQMKEKWKNTFASQLTTEECQRICLYSCLWDVFYSNKMAPCKMKDEAREAFDAIVKKEAYSFQEVNVMGKPEGDYSILWSDISSCKAKDLEQEEDIYIVDKDFKWTYVVTHETEYGCGPFFVMQNKQEI